MEDTKKRKKVSSWLLELLKEMTITENVNRFGWNEMFQNQIIKYFYLIRIFEKDFRQNNMQGFKAFTSKIVPLIKGDPNKFKSQVFNFPHMVPLGKAELKLPNDVVGYLRGNLIKLDPEELSKINSNNKIKSLDTDELQYDDFSNIYIVYSVDVNKDPKLLYQKKENRYSLVKFINNSSKTLYYYRVIRKPEIKRVY